MKPSDAFLGVIDFFSTLVPGAIALFLLIDQSWLHRPEGWPVIVRGSTEGWVVFLVSAYVIGHVIASLGSMLFDRLYDRVYARWRRGTSACARAPLGANPSRMAIIKQGIRHVLKKTNPDDELLAVAKTIKRRQLEKIAKEAGVNPDDVSDTYWWAGTVVRALLPAGAAEIDGLSAQSKLFRSLAVLVPLAALSLESVASAVIAGWLVALVLVLWRFMKLRWDATERIYEYFIIADVSAAPVEFAFVCTSKGDVVKTDS
jgi:hypothetical protein